MNDAQMNRSHGRSIIVDEPQTRFDISAIDLHFFAEFPQHSGPIGVELPIRPPG